MSRKIFHITYSLNPIGYKLNPIGYKLNPVGYKLNPIGYKGVIYEIMTTPTRVPLITLVRIDFPADSDVYSKKRDR
ncbi:hypothetical protein AGMMS49942_24720 [Spirochaetia bacterium]|nr:hypothetical protein AGMMS49942_24720 [Spirochaetia bacterium]